MKLLETAIAGTGHGDRRGEEEELEGFKALGRGLLSEELVPKSVRGRVAGTGDFTRDGERCGGEWEEVEGKEIVEGATVLGFWCDLIGGRKITFYPHDQPPSPAAGYSGRIRIGVRRDPPERFGKCGVGPVLCPRHVFAFLV